MFYKISNRKNNNSIKKTEMEGKKIQKNDSSNLIKFRCNLSHNWGNLKRRE